MPSPTKSPRPAVRHFLQFADFTAEEYAYLFERTRIIKDRFKRYELYHPLRDRTLAMVFEKHSTRTRVSFEAGMTQLGGAAIFLSHESSQMARGEPIEDLARVISGMVDVVMIRTFKQSVVERFAAYSRVPVINGLTDEHHPCQVLADVFTYIEQRGPIAGKIVCWVGDANNMLNSWMQAARILGFTVHASTPPGYPISPAQREAAGAHLRVFDDPMAAARGAHIVTTDVWTSMGFEAETEARRQAFAGWQVNEALMAVADPSAVFMHCLPAHRGEEVTAGVIDGPQSVVWEEAWNRLHVQKALLEYLVVGEVKS
ncbi:MAG: ornithine carbamoyltransferase [Casimicrobiaceae bacterium]|nr:ornithine carbamoyltransferase [Casimicrobiaceae bacterium]MDW8313184.1 ornithine carbamoyltransferase [Burkholderiales bacterium]